MLRGQLRAHVGDVHRAGARPITVNYLKHFQQLHILQEAVAA